MSERYGPSQPCFAPLRAVVQEIFERRTSQGKAVFKDPEAFYGKLETIAHTYARQFPASQDKESRRRYEAVAKAAAQMQAALSALSSRELETVNAQPIRHDASLLGHELMALSEDAYHSGPHAPSDLLSRHTLIWLHAAATSLAERNKAGRPGNSAEFQLAKKFVVLCHIEGWPLTAANSGSERRDGASPRESDSVTCLAAVFTEAGEHPTNSLRHAKTMLRKLRAPHSYEEFQHSDTYDWDRQPATITLKELRHQSDIGELPHFTPSVD